MHEAGHPLDQGRKKRLQQPAASKFGCIAGLQGVYVDFKVLIP